MFKHTCFHKQSSSLLVWSLQGSKSPCDPYSALYTFSVVTPTSAFQPRLMYGFIVLILVESQPAARFPGPVRFSFSCSVMGCFQSIACNKSRIKRENIVVHDLSATIDHCPTVIEENSPIVLRYKTPYFKAAARVVMPPIQCNETWIVGWIQACTQMEFYNTYGDIGM